MIVAGCAALALVATPVASAADRHDGVLFVANKAVGSVSRIRLSDGREEKRDEACETPHELAASPDGNYLAVGCYSGETIEILATDDLRNVATLFLEKGRGRMA